LAHAGFAVRARAAVRRGTLVSGAESLGHAAELPTEPLAMEELPAEHISLGSDEDRLSQSAAVTVSERITVRNPVRRIVTELTLYEEGFLKVVERRNARRIKAHRLDLHYLDPVPTITPIIAKRALYTALGCAAAAVLAALLAQFEPLRLVAWPAAIGAALGSIGALLAAWYSSCVKIRFCTLHGRAPVLSFVAHLGCIGRFRALIPVLNRAIDDAAEAIGSDPSAYLRAEMREHYRLRGDGVLTPESCTDSTGRILAQFDVQL
jgi:hypothetical protein